MAQEGTLLTTMHQSWAAVRSGMSLERTLTTRSRTMRIYEGRDSCHPLYACVTRRRRLATYDIMEWHLKETKPSPATKHLVRKFLRGKGVQTKRYNVNRLVQHYKTDTPSSKSLSTSSEYARALVTSILTDPRLEDKDYLFFDDDPFKPPPISFMSLTSIPAWLAKTITDPSKQMLIMLPCYIDGATTGQYWICPLYNSS
jgi:hypothetical protein